MNVFNLLFMHVNRKPMCGWAFFLGKRYLKLGENQAWTFHFATKEIRKIK